MKETIASRKDFRVDTFRCGGKGGQHQNKTDSGARVTHIPSGLSAECRETRSQHTNRTRAFNKLAPKVVNWWKTRNGEKDMQSYKNEEIIRTYNFQRGTAKDHRSGVTKDLKKVLDGDIEGFKIVP